jgi:hypothetical protein
VEAGRALEESAELIGKSVAAGNLNATAAVAAGGRRSCRHVRHEGSVGQ